MWLEIAVTDFCNLSCPLCSQGTPIQKNKQTTQLSQWRELSQFFKANEFEVIKISGGEPTMHPEFGEICRELPQLFPASSYQLATNGFKLMDFLDVLSVFQQIDLTLYPGENDEVFRRLDEQMLPNMMSSRKRDYVELEDVFRESNTGRQNIYQNCGYRKVKKIVQNRIYQCCVVFGQSVRQNIPLAEISVEIDKNWRENLAKLNIERHCERCFVDVFNSRTDWTETY